MLCAAIELNLTLLLNKVAFLYLLNILAVLVIITAPIKGALWNTNPFIILCELLA